MMKGRMPKLTLGGYLMRQHRLLGLRDRLDGSERERLDATITQFNQAFEERIVRLEQKAHRELDARLRQWSEFLKDLEWEKFAAIASYKSAVETRMMIAAIMELLQTAPLRLESRIGRQVRLLDANLRRQWRTGDFVWPDEWKPAYPAGEYWWLYGTPR
jgi:hypothetical protein